MEEHKKGEFGMMKRQTNKQIEPEERKKEKANKQPNEKEAKEGMIEGGKKGL